MRKSVHLGSLGLMLLLATNEAQATLLFSSGFESPTVATGFATGAPTGWNYFTNNGTYGVTHTASPLASPAGGSQYLVLSGVNTGISALTGALIRPNVIYTLSAAIGKPDNTFSDSWSIQLFAGTAQSTGSNFIGQQWAAHQGANIPTIGGWATNTFTFNGSDVPALQGAQIVILLNNYLSGQSAYDSITLSDNLPDPPAGPEPISSAIFGMGLLGLGLARARRMSCPAL